MSYILPIAVTIFFSIVLVLFIIETRTPVKYAVKLEDIYDYPNAILVRETGHTGTGWERVGDEHGLYTDFSNVQDVQIVGNMPREVKMGVGYSNIFLCKITYLGKTTMPTLGDDMEFDKYEVIDWYPIYPVKRDSILPSWFYPADYISKFDLS